MTHALMHLELFRGRRLAISTKHKKERVIQPILEKELGVQCIVPERLDTDVFGTFSSEVERTNDPLTTARKKCELAMKVTGTDLAIASEGSFGAHPTLFFTQADTELILLVDQKNDIEIVGHVTSTETNFSGIEVTDRTQLREFAHSVGFPAHALILRPGPDETKDLFKGICNWTALWHHFERLMSKYSAVYAETDMRALFNPKRMKVIESATANLIERVKSCCPNCRSPGFWINDVKPGLPCAECGMPTRSVAAYCYECRKCEHLETRPNTDRSTEDPAYCDFCNP